MSLKNIDLPRVFPFLGEVKDAVSGLFYDGEAFTLSKFDTDFKRFKSLVSQVPRWML